MLLKHCPCCGKQQTTDNSDLIGTTHHALWFNCMECRSTFLISKADSGIDEMAQILAKVLGRWQIDAYPKPIERDEVYVKAHEILLRMGQK